jgi:deoxycytidine triphosphate deaminase
VILSDRSIKEAIASGRLGINPFDAELVQPSSIDVRLDSKFLVFRNTKRAYIDVKQPADDLMEMIEVGLDEPMFLHPHEFVLGSTIERVRMPDDLVARLEGRSSLGRLGVVIHSSLPYDAPVLFLDRDGTLEPRPIGEIVENRLEGRVVGFDKDTFEVGLHPVTNWFRELPDKIYEIRLSSGRRLQVTAGHNVFTIDSAGELVRTPTGALRPGTRVAIPKRVPDASVEAPEVRLLELLPAHVRAKLMCHGPTVDAVLGERPRDVQHALRRAARSASYYARKRSLPLPILEALAGGPAALSAEDRLSYRGSHGSLAAVMTVDQELAWLLGLYVVQGHRRRGQINIANTDPHILDRAEAVFRRLGQRVYRNKGSITCRSVLVAAWFEALGMGGGAAAKRLPRGFLGWPRQQLDALLAGLTDGDGSVRRERECLWTASEELVSQTLLAATRLGQRAVTQRREPRPGHVSGHVVSFMTNRHKVLTSVPNRTLLLSDSRRAPVLSQVSASRLCGYGRSTCLNDLETYRGAGAVHVATLERIHGGYARVVASVFRPIQKLTRLVHGDLNWDEVVDVVDTGRFETVYDLEVRPRNGAHVENFLAGFGGVFASNTAGFIDASFEGHITLEISNLANLPIALYPRMRIGQLSFSMMTTPAERPYGAGRGSKYSGQALPTASRLYLDFQQR